MNGVCVKIEGGLNGWDLIRWDLNGFEGWDVGLVCKNLWVVENLESERMMICAHMSS